MSGSGVGGTLILITQVVLLVLNYIYAWNLPWYILFAPLLIIGAWIVFICVLFVIVLFAALVASI